MLLLSIIAIYVLIGVIFGTISIIISNVFNIELPYYRTYGNGRFNDIIFLGVPLWPVSLLLIITMILKSWFKFVEKISQKRKNNI